ncbi:hypothetical protein CKO15_07085 [Halorhodospira abdelmalekii]|uniref:DUF481 domain-containing protein n=1 Tax=Halorhodospira abdelmalekii TaxID=421629 RepID=UPI0019074C6B|nr:DUF481 domain-containing protein [Halorhodospira abdelmalekii]MBK1735052.1 hypothetical protein [Halorhodospira abdelmalekii]
MSAYNEPVRTSPIHLFVAAAAVCFGAGVPLSALAGESERRTEAEATAGASIHRGNTDSERYSVTFDYRARSAVHRVVFDAEANRGKSDGVQDVNNTRAGTKYDWFFHGPWYANTNVSWRQDREADLYGRYSLGAGLGYQFFDDERLRLSAEFGPSYIYEKALATRASSDEGAVRWALDYRQYILDGVLRLFHRHELVMTADDSDDWFATTRTGLRLPLYESLSVSLQLNYDYDNQTTAEHRYDSTTLLTLTYDWH